MPPNKKMKKTIVLIVAAAMCLMIFTSCAPVKATVEASGSKVAGDGSAIVETVPTINVSGEAKLSAAPDMVTINVGTEAHDATMEEAYARNTELNNAVIAALKQQGIEEKNVQTSNYNMWQNTEKGKTVCYVSSMLEIKLYDISKASSVLGAAVNAGATQSYGMYFGIADPDARYGELAAEAVKSARAKADAIAAAMGKTVDEAIFISDGSASYEPVYREAAAPAESSADTGASMNIMAGELELSASLSIKYTIK